MTRFLWPRIMLTGKNGQVGWELQRTLATLGEVIALNRQELDLSNPEQIRAMVRQIRPSLIVNAAAYTAVDKAEEEPELAMAVNGIAPGILAEEGKRVGAAIVHYSTDYVFDGTKTTPYTEDDEPNPINVYGRTKLEGERAVQAVGAAHLIVRTSWVYGLRGRNFLLTILRLSKEQGEIRVVDDQIGSPTWSRMISQATAQVLATGESAFTQNGGVYHVSARGKTSWYGFAMEIMSNFESAAKLIPISSMEYSAAAARPVYSVLANKRVSKAFGVSTWAWERALEACVSNPD